MHCATPIRERNGASEAKCFGFCTCAPSSWADLPSHVPSADTLSPRICTFSTYLNFNPFNTYILASLNSSSFCTYKNRGRGDITFPKASAWPFPLFSSFPAGIAFSLITPPPAGTFAGHSRVFCVLSEVAKGHWPHRVFNNLHTQFFQVPYSQAFAHSAGRGFPNF